MLLRRISSDEDEEEDLLAGLSRPQLGAFAATGADEDEDEDDREEEAAAAPAPAPHATVRDADGDDDIDEGNVGGGGGSSGLVGAEAAFEFDSAPGALELDPFRIAAGVDVPLPAEPADAKAKAKGGKAGAAIPRKIFVGGLSRDTDDAGLVRFFARYGKVQEASVVGSRGFGFVTFVNDKGARFCLKEAGDPPKVSIDGRECTVRYAQEKDSHGARLHKMPARGNVDYLGLNQKRGAGSESGAGRSGGSAEGGELGAPGVAMIAAAHKRSLPGHSLDSSDDAGGGGAGKRKKKEIVTVSRRQGAEPLDKRPITMKEIFPKEFWRI
jgi:hypothetical protein